MAAESTKLPHVAVYHGDHELVSLLAKRKKVSAAQVVRELIEAAVPRLPEPDRRFLAAIAAVSD